MAVDKINVLSAEKITGNVVVIPAKVYNTAIRQLGDPTAIAIKLVDPSGRKSSLGVTRDGVGSYHTEVVAGVSGLYRYLIEASGSLVAATEGGFMVKESIAAFG